MNQKLINQLKSVIGELSINALSSIYPEQLAEWLNISEKDLIGFINDLYTERLIAYKYKFKCRCGNNCTAYQRKLKNNKYVCANCGAIYDLDDIAKKGTLVYDLEKSDILEYKNDEIDFKEESFKAVNLVDYVSCHQEENKENAQMEIFLGSSSEAIADMEDVAYLVEKMNHKPLLWNSAGSNIFPPNANTIDSLIAISKRVQAAIFIFNEDDKIWHHNSLKETTTVRDNVLFEYGLFCGALSKSKVCFVCKGKPKLASDLDGVTYISLNDQEITLKRKLQDWINAM